LNLILFDLNEVVNQSKAAALCSNIKFESGNFFETVTAKADIYLLKRVIHDWDDLKSIKILRNISNSMKSESKVVLIEAVIPSLEEIESRNDWSKWLDVHMMVVTGGRERTLNEYSELFDAAGLKFNRIIPTDSPLSLIEAVKK